MTFSTGLCVRRCISPPKFPELVILTTPKRDGRERLQSKLWTSRRQIWQKWSPVAHTSGTRHGLIAEIFENVCFRFCFCLRHQYFLKSINLKSYSFKILVAFLNYVAVKLENINNFCDLWAIMSYQYCICNYFVSILILLWNKTIVTSF